MEPLTQREKEIIARSEYNVTGSHSVIFYDKRLSQREMEYLRSLGYTDITVKCKYDRGAS